MSIDEIRGQKGFSVLFVVIAALSGLSWFYLLADSSSLLFASGIFLPTCNTKDTPEFLSAESVLRQLVPICFHWFTMNIAMLMPIVLLQSISQSSARWNLSQFLLQSIQFGAMSMVFAIAATGLTIMSAATSAPFDIWMSACVFALILRVLPSAPRTKTSGAFACAASCFAWMCMLLTFNLMHVTWMAVLTCISLLHHFFTLKISCSND